MKRRDEAPLLFWTQRVYQLLAVVLPRNFRDEWADELHRAFCDTYRAEFADGGLWRALQFSGWAVGQLFVCAVRERRAGKQSSGRARRGLLLEVGGRSGWSSTLFARTAQDLRHAVRMFAKTPGFSLASIGIIGLGIGATTTIYSIVDKVLLRGLPYENADRIVFFENPSHTVPEFLDWRDRTSAFAALAGARIMDYDFTGDGPPRNLRTALVTRDFFATFGAQPLLGRLFVPEDFATPAAAVVLSFPLWRQRWGADPNLIGRRITLNGKPVVVVGVLDPTFQFPEAVVGTDIDAWLPFDVNNSDYHHRGLYIVDVAARLAPDISLAGAQSQLNTLGEALAEEFPDRYRRPDGTALPATIAPLFDATVSSVADTLYMLLGAVGLMLLIACANVANLFLARGTGRAREIALRAALGAGRRRILAQLLTESVVLSLMGGVAGIGIAWLGLGAFTWFNPGGIPRIADVAMDHRVLGFTIVISLVTGVLFGIVPGVHAAKTDVTEVLKDGSGGATTGRAGRRLRDGLVVAELALALVLMAGAGVLFNSFIRLQRVDAGIRTEQLVTIPLALSRQSSDERLRFTTSLVERLYTLPGTQAVGAGVSLPFVFIGGDRCCWRIDLHRQPDRSSDPEFPIVHPVTADYFAAIGATLKEGRPFDERDGASEPTPVILNASFARRLFGEESAVGELLYGSVGSLSVVGVVNDVRHWGLDEEIDPELYVPYAGAGNGFSRLDVALRTTAPFASLPDLIRDAVWSLDPNLPVEGIVTMRDRVAESIGGERFYSALLTVFAAVAIALAAAGIYSSMLYSVGQRYRELGVRLALGARAGDVVRLIVRKGIVLTGMGVAIGLVGAFALSRTLESLVFGVSAADLPTFAAVSLMLGAVAVIACYLPARTAGKADPIVTLRAE